MLLLLSLQVVEEGHLHPYPEGIALQDQLLLPEVS